MRRSYQLRPNRTGRRYKVRRGIVFVSLVLVLPLFYIGCAARTTQTHWSEEPSGRLSAGSQTKATTMKVDSIPKGADVLVGGKRFGKTPQQLTLNYELECIAHQRTLYRTTRSLSYLDCFLEGLTLGAVPARTREKKEVIDRQVKEEYRVVPREYKISILKTGYFPKTLTVVAPRDDDQVFTVQLIQQEALTIEPVQIVQGVEKRVPPLRWLRDHLFFPKGLAKSQHPAFAREVANRLQSRIAESIYFLSVSVAKSDGKSVSGASIEVEAQLYMDRILLRGQMRSARVFGSRVITREVQIDNRDFPAGLSKVCSDLADQLVQAYTAGLPKD